MRVILHRVAQRLPPRAVPVEHLQFAAAIIIKPLDAPLAGRLAILENLGWFKYGDVGLTTAATIVATRATASTSH